MAKTKTVTIQKTIEAKDEEAREVRAQVLPSSVKLYEREGWSVVSEEQLAAEKAESESQDEQTGQGEGQSPESQGDGVTVVNAGPQPGDGQQAENVTLESDPGAAGQGGENGSDGTAKSRSRR